MSSERWKALERDAARVLGGERVPRWLDFMQSAPDVLVPDFGLVVDAKAYARFAHHRLIENVQVKYCEPGETPLLVTREPGQRAYATVPLDYLGELLTEIRKRRSVLPVVNTLGCW